MSFIELPFGFPGRVFRSPMPFGQYDLHSEVYDRFCEEQITLLSSWLRATRMLLRRAAMDANGIPHPGRTRGAD